MGMNVSGGIPQNFPQEPVHGHKHGGGGGHIKQAKQDPSIVQHGVGHKEGVVKQGHQIPIQKKEEAQNAPETKSERTKDRSKDDDEKKKTLMQDEAESAETEHQKTPYSDTLGPYKFPDTKYLSKRFPPKPPVSDR
jgi:hypothetical protein